MMEEEFVEEFSNVGELPEGVLGIEELDDEELETSGGGTISLVTQSTNIKLYVDKVKGFQWISNPIGATISTGSTYFLVRRGSKYGTVSFKGTFYNKNTGTVSGHTWKIKFIPRNYTAQGVTPGVQGIVGGSVQL